MRSYYYIRHARFQIFYCLFLLFCGSETVKQFYLYGIIRHTFYKCRIVLLCQNRRRDKIRHLFSVLYGLERRPYGYFRFSVADVSADKSVHYFAGFHILFYILYRIQLVVRFRIVEVFLKFPLPRRIGRIFEAFRRLSFCVNLHQILGKYRHRSLYL